MAPGTPFPPCLGSLQWSVCHGDGMQTRGRSWVRLWGCLPIPRLWGFCRKALSDRKVWPCSWPELSPFSGLVLQRCLSVGPQVILIHLHPWHTVPSFSRINILIVKAWELSPSPGLCLHA